MFDYERLQKDLNQYANYLLISLKREYGSFFSKKKEEKINKMINDGNLVVIDSLVGQDKIHISPSHYVFKNQDYKSAKEFFENNLLVSELLRFFITLSISEEEFASLSRANLEQSFQIFLKKGFTNYISREFCLKNRLKVPEYRNNESILFVEKLENKITNFSSIKRLVFEEEYLFFCEHFYEQTGEDILDLYLEFLKERDKLEEIELLEDDKTFIESR